MASISEFRKLLLTNPEVAKMIVPSARNEVYMDVNGDGKPNFAFINSSCDFTGNGSVDTFAIDLGGDGEFDLYLRDSDGNWIPDQITYFRDGEPDPVIETHPEKSREMVEKVLAAPGMKLVEVMSKFAEGKGGADEFKAGIMDYVDGCRKALRELWASYQKSGN